MKPYELIVSILGILAALVAAILFITLLFSTNFGVGV